jgi:hypothetical protein
MSINEHVTLESDDSDQSKISKSLNPWQTPELKSIQISIDTKDVCDASNPCIT